MRVPLVPILFTILIAGGFMALGEAILRRRVRDGATGNEALLTGMGAGAAALFLLSLAWPHGALRAVAVLLGAALLWAIGIRVFPRLRPSREPAPDRPPSAPLDPAARLLFAALALEVAAFATLNFRYAYAWDGFVIWASKAQYLFQAGGLTREWYPTEQYDQVRVLNYPSLVPLWEALLALPSGRFDFGEMKPVFMVFYLSLLAGTYAMVRGRLSARAAALATLVVGLLPMLSTGYAAGGYADMPQAAIVAGVAGAALNERERALPWLIGALTTVKAEGLLLAGLACGAVVLYWILSYGRNALGRLAPNRNAIAIVSAFLLLRLAYVRWIPVRDVVYSGSLADAVGRVFFVGRLCLKELVDWTQWGLFWPGFFLAAAALLAGGTRHERVLAAAVTGGLLILMVPFLFTTWSISLHVVQAYSRLAAQIAPAAAAVLILGYCNARDRLAGAHSSR